MEEGWLGSCLVMGLIEGVLGQLLMGVCDVVGIAEGGC